MLGILSGEVNLVFGHLIALWLVWAGVRGDYVERSWNLLGTTVLMLKLLGVLNFGRLVKLMIYYFLGMMVYLF